MPEAPTPKKRIIGKYPYGFVEALKNSVVTEWTGSLAADTGGVTVATALTYLQCMTSDGLMTVKKTPIEGVKKLVYVFKFIALKKK